MPRARPDALIRSAVFRLTFVNLALLVAAFFAAGVGGWLITRGTVDRDARDRIAIEVHAITVELAQEGRERAAQAIHARSERPGALEYLLLDPRGQRIAGDFLGAPRTPGWHDLDADEGATGLEGKDRLIARTVVMPDGSVLIVGDDLGRADAVRKTVFVSIFAAGAVALTLSLIVGVFVSLGVARRMRRMVATVHAVEGGDMAARTGIAARRNDDVDALATAIDAMLGRITELVATVRRVSAEIAHDLRTPLTRARHALEKAYGVQDLAECLAMIAVAEESIDAALRLFDAMLDLAEIDSGEARAQFTSVDLASIAEDVVDAYRPEIEQSGRTVALTIDDKLVIDGDPDLLTRALANLVDNALKHSRAGAKIAVTLRRSENSASVCVEDDGPGVDPTHVETMLRPFGRLDAARTTPGNGLGLAIADSTARLHGGTLGVHHLEPGLRMCLHSLALCSTS